MKTSEYLKWGSVLTLQVVVPRDQVDTVTSRIWRDIAHLPNQWEKYPVIEIVPEDLL